MNIFCVGGAVRDHLLGKPVHDRDWVVVGATPQEMLAAGFTPVGKDFPVFLHPLTQEEYALARTERKTGPGYKGFAVHFDPSVSLEDDLLRRDLTVNAMAQWAADRLDHPALLKSKNLNSQQPVIDPYGGRKDLQAKCLRHVSPAFVEDPLRVLRLARFAARFDDFSLAQETQALLTRMAQGGELDDLVPERIWQELARGLMELTPSRMFEVLLGCNALGAMNLALSQSLQGALGPLDFAAQQGLTLEVRFALLVHAMPSLPSLQNLCEQWRVPNEARDLALLLYQHHLSLSQVGMKQGLPLRAQQFLKVLELCDVKRRPERFKQLLAAAQCLNLFDQTPWRLAEQAMLQVDEASLAKSAPEPSQIKALIHQARLNAIEKSLALAS